MRKAVEKLVSALRNYRAVLAETHVHGVCGERCVYRILDRDARRALALAKK